MKKGKRADEKEEKAPSPSRCARHLSLGERLNDSLPKALPVGELREAVRGVKKERRLLAVLEGDVDFFEGMVDLFCRSDGLGVPLVRGSVETAECFILQDLQD